MSELKPCPFCGAEPMHYKSFTKVTIGCRSADCHVNPTFSIGKRDNPEEKWNSRIYDRMVEEIAELKGAINQLLKYNGILTSDNSAVVNAKELLAKLNQEGEE